MRTMNMEPPDFGPPGQLDLGGQLDDGSPDFGPPGQTLQPLGVLQWIPLPLCQMEKCAWHTHIGWWQPSLEVLRALKETLGPLDLGPSGPLDLGLPGLLDMGPSDLGPLGPLDLGQWTLRLLCQIGKCTWPTDTSEALKSVERPLGALDLGPFRITNINI